MSELVSFSASLPCSLTLSSVPVRSLYVLLYINYEIREVHYNETDLINV